MISFWLAVFAACFAGLGGFLFGLVIGQLQRPQPVEQDQEQEHEAEVLAFPRRAAGADR